MKHILKNILKHPLILFISCQFSSIFYCHNDRAAAERWPLFGHIDNDYGMKEYCWRQSAGHVWSVLAAIIARVWLLFPCTPVINVESVWAEPTFYGYNTYLFIYNPQKTSGRRLFC